MSTRTLARGLAVSVVMAVMLTTVGVPAASAAPVGTASINAADRSIVAGTSEAAFRITVVNTASALPNQDLTFNPSVNHVAVIPPQGRYTPVADFGTLPSGWTGRLNGQGFYIFEHSGAGLAPGTNAVFTVKAAVGRPTVDLARLWRVNLSSDRGVSNSPATEATPGALTTTIKVLQILDTRINDIPAVNDNDVTSGQTVNVDVSVFNAGSAAPGTFSVLPSISSSGTGTASVTCPPARDVPGGTGTTFRCAVTFGGSGGVTLTGDATGTHPDGTADGIAKNSSLITVMSAAAFSYAPTTLQPTDVSPGKPVTFQLSVNKTGDVLVNLNKANTTLSFGPAGGPTFTAALAEPATIQGGTQNGTLLKFVQATVPATMPADSVPPAAGYREYTPTLTINGVDQNDFGVSATPSITDNIIVDALGPIIDITANPPASRVAGRNAAATNGATVTFTGTIRDRGALCAGCTITSSVIRQYSASGAPLAVPGIPVTISNDGGNLSGTFNGNYSTNPMAHFMSLEVVGSDGANSTTKNSNIVEVDNIAPLLVSALTGGEDANGTRANDRTRIDVSLSELVRVTAISPTDWTVDGHRVVAAKPCAPQTTTSFDCVTLTVDPQMGRNEETTVTYAPTAPTRPEDRVGLILPNASVPAIDGILPALPVVDEIGGLPKQDNQYFTNQVQPGVSVTIEPGDTVSLWVGAISGAPRCTATAEGNNTQVVCNATFPSQTQDTTYTLLLRSEDARGNIGPVTTETLTIDLTAPVIQTAVRQGSDIVVGISEKLGEVSGKNQGRNFSNDWTVRFRQAGEEDADQARAVSGTGNSRTIGGTAGASWNAAGTNTHRLIYQFDTAAPGGGRRYADRAGNDMADTTVNVSS